MLKTVLVYLTLGLVMCFSIGMLDLLDTVFIMRIPLEGKTTLFIVGISITLLGSVLLPILTVIQALQWDNEQCEKAKRQM
jgi:hypothetical protein